MLSSLDLVTHTHIMSRQEKSITFSDMKGLALFLVHVCFIFVLDIRPLVGHLRQLHADFCHS